MTNLLGQYFVLYNSNKYFCSPIKYCTHTRATSRAYHVLVGDISQIIAHFNKILCRLGFYLFWVWGSPFTTYGPLKKGGFSSLFFNIKRHYEIGVSATLVIICEIYKQNII